jgi:ABC-type transport system involved in cytochrome bd biosynthesis fused ATPase/permease subunit
VILDEITAGVNAGTQRLMLDLVFTEFRDSTVLITGEKAGIVTRCNRVMVLGEGKIIDFRDPGVLQMNAESYYAKQLVIEKEILKMKEEEILIEEGKGGGGVGTGEV